MGARPGATPAGPHARRSGRGQGCAAGRAAGGAPSAWDPRKGRRPQDQGEGHHPVQLLTPHPPTPQQQSRAVTSLGRSVMPCHRTPNPGLALSLGWKGVRRGQSYGQGPNRGGRRAGMGQAPTPRGPDPEEQTCGQKAPGTLGPRGSTWWPEILPGERPAPCSLSLSLGHASPFV